LYLLAERWVAAFLSAFDLLAAVALLFRLAMGLFGFLLVYRVVADRERDCSAVDLRTAVFCRLLLERFAAPAAVMELLRRDVALLTPARSVLAAVLAVPAFPTALVLLLRLLPLVMLAALAFEGSTLLAPYLV
jgi:hypothetical protein